MLFSSNRSENVFISSPFLNTNYSIRSLYFKFVYFFYGLHKYYRSNFELSKKKPVIKIVNISMVLKMNISS